MNSNDGALSFDAYINNTDFKRQIDEMNNRIRGLSDSTVKETNKMDSAFTGIGKTMLALGGTAAMTGFVRQLATVRGEFQQLEVAFTTMLGSKERSDKLMAQIVETAAKTPFTLTQVAAGAKQLLAYQVAAEDVNETVIRLGNIAAGVSVPLDRLILAYGQVKAKGRLQGDDMRQFTEAGIPIIHELAKVLGVADNQISKLVEGGKIGFPQVQQVIQNLTNEGGMFFNLMEKQSKTLTGQISNLEDAWSRMLNKIGQSNEGLMSGIITGATSVVDNYQEILDVIIPIVAAYGAYKAAVIATAVAQKAAAAATFAKEYIIMGRAVGFATANQIAFNKASLANPYMLALAALTGLAVAIYRYTKNTQEATEAQRRMSEVNKKVSDSVTEQKGKIELLRATVKNQALSDTQRYEAIKQLKEIMPDYNAEISKEGKLITESTDAIEKYLKQLELKIKMTAVQDELSELWKKERDQIKQLDEATKEYNKSKERQAEISKAGYTGTGLSGSNMGGNIISDADVVRAGRMKNEAQSNLDATRQAIADLKGEYSGAEKDMAAFLSGGSPGGGTPKRSRTVDIIEAEIKALQAEQKAKSENSEKWIEYQLRINKLLEERNAITEVIIEREKGISQLPAGGLKMPEIARERKTPGLRGPSTASVSYLNSLFADLDKYAVEELIRLKNTIEEQFKNMKLSPEDLKAVREKIEEVTREIEKRNPFLALSEAIKKYKKDQSTVNLKEVFKDASASIDIVKGTFDSLVGSLDKLGVKTDEGTNKALQDISGMVGGASSLAMGIATGNPLQVIQGSIDLISNGIDLIAGAKDRKLQRSIAQHQEAVDRLRQSYEQLERAIDKVVGSDRYKTQQQLISNVQKQQQQYQEMLSAESSKKKSDLSKINEYKQAIIDGYNQIADIVNGLREDILGGSIQSVASDLGNAIIDAFSAGEDAAAAWGNKVNEVVGEVIRKMLIQKLVEEPVGRVISTYMTKWVDGSGNFLGFDAVMSSAAEMGKELSALGPGLSELLNTLPDDIKKYLVGDEKKGSAMTGQIKGVTEETASVLTGQINAIRINQIESVSVMRNQLMALDKIAANTAYLESIDKRLASIASSDPLRANGLG